MALALHCHTLACTLQAGASHVFAVTVGFDGPIRSRLVENGYLGQGESATATRQGSGPRAWPQQDEAEANGPPVSSTRPMVGDTGQRPLLIHGPGPSRTITDHTRIIWSTDQMHCALLLSSFHLARSDQEVSLSASAKAFMSQSKGTCLIARLCSY